MAQLDFYIYKYHFLKTKQSYLRFEEEGADGDSNIAMAEKCFESLFDERNIPNLVKTKKKGESTRLCNSVFKKDNDILLWQVNNNLPKGIWKPTGKDSNGNEQYEKETVESVPPCFVMISFTFSMVAALSSSSILALTTTANSYLFILLPPFGLWPLLSKKQGFIYHEDK